MAVVHTHEAARHIVTLSMAFVPAIPLAIELAEIGITTYEAAVPVAEFLEANPWAARLTARAGARAFSAASRGVLGAARRRFGTAARAAERRLDRLLGSRRVDAAHRTAQTTVGQLSENQILGLLGAGTVATGGLVAADVIQHGTGGRLPNTFPSKKPAKDPTQPPDSGRNRPRGDDDGGRDVRPAHSTADDMDDMPGGAAGGDPDDDDDMDDDDDWPYKPGGGGGDDNDDGAS
jgi:hypothetical protein